MKNRLMQFAGCLALLAVLGKFYAKPLMAQVRAAIVQDRDAAGRNFTYQQASCISVAAGYCEADFPAVPAGKRLIVTNASMLNLMPNANTITSIDLRGNNGYIQAFLPLASNPGVAGTYNYTVNQPVFAKFDAGETPELFTFSTGSGSFQMAGVLTGYLIDIP